MLHLSSFFQLLSRLTVSDCLLRRDGAEMWNRRVRTMLTPRPPYCLRRQYTAIFSAERGMAMLGSGHFFLSGSRTEQQSCTTLTPSRSSVAKLVCDAEIRWQAPRWWCKGGPDDHDQFRQRHRHGGRDRFAAGLMHRNRTSTSAMSPPPPVAFAKSPSRQLLCSPGARLWWIDHSSLLPSAPLETPTYRCHG